MADIDAPELDDLKQTLKTMWTAGDYSVMARSMEKSARSWLAGFPLSPGECVLDVACGSGQLTLPAARAGATVTGLDIAPNWIEKARQRAHADGLDIRFDVADAEDMPYENGEFDLVISLIGAMFTPRPDRAAAEMLRVTRPGGRIVMGNWTPDGMVGDFFRIVGKYAPPPPEMPSPLLWGEEETVKRRLGAGVRDIRFARRMMRFEYALPPSAVTDIYLEYFGPTHMAVAGLDADGHEALHADLTRLWSKANQASGDRTVADAEFLEVVAVRA